MNAETPLDDGQSARLLRAGSPTRPGMQRTFSEAPEIARGSVSDLVEIVRGDDREEVWRYTIVLDSGKHLRSAELRALIRPRSGSA